jgi:hypothetical protein
VSNKRKVRFKSVASRLTGFSTPIFGISWNPPEAEVVAAHRILSFLEDRRVLFVPAEIEVPGHCVTSVLQIRASLTDEIGRPGLSDELSGSLRAMRAACRKFLDVAQDADARLGWDLDSYHRGHSAQWDFDSAIGQLRGVFGIHVALLAARYGLDVEEGLASILPVEDDESAAREIAGDSLPDHDGK